jgi:DNA-binding IclR family transcriptional regulator
MDANDSTLQTSTTSLAILDAIADHDGASLSELADQFDLAQSTIHTHLTTLYENGVIVKEGSEYYPGLKLLGLGEIAKNRKSEYQIARREAQGLAENVNEEVAFSVEEHGRAIIVFAENSDPSREGFQAGRRFYMHASAGGKAILSKFDDEHIDDVIERWGLPHLTDHTITDREALFDDIERIRERGYSISDQEALDGLTAIGVPVMYPDGQVFGSLDVSGPAYRIAEKRDTITGLLLDARDKLEDDVEMFASAQRSERFRS